MKNLFATLMVMGTCLLLTVATSSPAEAKRLGGGSSFGSKFSHSDSVKRSSPDQSVQRQSSPAAQQNTQAKQQMASKGGMMGILGGLAIGGLLGALFFGGAFENINFFDILIFGLIAFILFKLFASRPRQPATANGPTSHEFSSEMPQQSNSPAQPTASQQKPDNSFGGITLDQLRSEISSDFDKEGFLEGAKSCYARLQHAWDDSDLADLRQFTTDHVFAELQEQLRNRQQASDTKILSLNAELMSTRQLGESMEATVLFEARLNEDGEETLVSEVWHFVRPAGALTPTWYLDGIQQVEK